MAPFSSYTTDHITAASPPPSPILHQTPKDAIFITISDAMSPPAPATTDNSAHSQWLRAAVLGAPEGLVSVASIIIGVGAINQTPLATVITGLAGLIAGTCSMAIGEFVSVYTLYDMEVGLLRRRNAGGFLSDHKKSQLPSPGKAAAASALAFTLGGTLPLLAGGFIVPWRARTAAVVTVSSIGLVTFGAAGATLACTPVLKTTARVLVGGLLAMLVTYGILSLFGLAYNKYVLKS